VVPPYFENFGKRLIKSPKVDLGDSGLGLHLLGITSPAELERSPFLGPIFEGFLPPKYSRTKTKLGGRKELYTFGSAGFGG